MPTLAVVLALVALAIAMGVASRDRGMKTESLVVLLDPTILDSSEEVRFSAIQDALADAISTLASNTFVSGYMVDLDMIHAAPFLVDSLPFYTGYRDGHAADVERVQRRVRDSFAAAWQFAHSGDRTTVATSCLLSSLYKADSDLARAPSGSGRVVLVVSDLVEACADWKTRLSFESAIPDVDAIAGLVGGRMSHTDRVYVILVEHATYKKVLLRDSLRAAWKRIAAGMGVPEAQVTIDELAPPKDYWH